MSLSRHLDPNFTFALSMMPVPVILTVRNIRIWLQYDVENVQEFVRVTCDHPTDHPTPPKKEACEQKVLSGRPI